MKRLILLGILLLIPVVYGFTSMQSEGVADGNMTLDQWQRIQRNGSLYITGSSFLYRENDTRPEYGAGAADGNITLTQWFSLFDIFQYANGSRPEYNDSFFDGNITVAQWNNLFDNFLFANGSRPEYNAADGNITLSQWFSLFDIFWYANGTRPEYAGDVNSWLSLTGLIANGTFINNGTDVGKVFINGTKGVSTRDLLAVNSMNATYFYYSNGTDLRALFIDTNITHSQWFSLFDTFKYANGSRPEYNDSFFDGNITVAQWNNLFDNFLYANGSRPEYTDTDTDTDTQVVLVNLINNGTFISNNSNVGYLYLNDSLFSRYIRGVEHVNATTFYYSNGTDIRALFDDTNITLEQLNRVLGNGTYDNITLNTLNRLLGNGTYDNVTLNQLMRLINNGTIIIDNGTHSEVKGFRITGTTQDWLGLEMTIRNVLGQRVITGNATDLTIWNINQRVMKDVLLHGNIVIKPEDYTLSGFEAFIKHINTLYMDTSDDFLYFLHFAGNFIYSNTPFLGIGPTIFYNNERITAKTNNVILSGTAALWTGPVVKADGVQVTYLGLLSSFWDLMQFQNESGGTFALSSEHTGYVSGMTILSDSYFPERTGYRVTTAGGTGRLGNQIGIKIDDWDTATWTNIGIYSHQNDTGNGQSWFIKHNGTAPSDIRGNTTIILYYGEMYGHNSGLVSLSSADTYYNVTNLTEGDSNGFDFDTYGNSELIVPNSGVYQVSSSWSFEGTANQEYHITLAVNNMTQQQDCHAARVIGTGADVGSASFTCLKQLDKDDFVNLMIENLDSADDPTIRDINLNLVRIGG